MSKYYSELTNESILEAIVKAWKETEKDFCGDYLDPYKRGRYTAMLDLLKVVKIHETEEVD